MGAQNNFIAAKFQPMFNFNCNKVQILTLDRVNFKITQYRKMSGMPYGKGAAKTVLSLPIKRGLCHWLDHSSSCDFVVFSYMQLSYLKFIVI